MLGILQNSFVILGGSRGQERFLITNIGAEQSNRLWAGRSSDTHRHEPAPHPPTDSAPL